MATLASTIITNARTTLLETSARYWTDAELLVHVNAGIKDLWKAIIDLYKGHFVTVDETNMLLAAETALVTGVPADLFRALIIRPRVVGDASSNPGLVFQYRDSLTHPDFVQAEATRSITPRQQVIYYTVLNAGAPVAAPAIKCAPKVTAQVLLSVSYIPVLAAIASNGTNPIPGESDKALEAYTIAWARAKEREDRTPDPEFIAIYATEKRNLLTVLTPRSEQDPEVVDSFFQDIAGYGHAE